MENKENNKQCNIHVLPSTISDEDISALLGGIVSIIKKKYELEKQNAVLNMTENIAILKKQLKEKIAECNRLKNEILYLKSK